MEHGTPNAYTHYGCHCPACTAAIRHLHAWQRGEKFLVTTYVDGEPHSARAFRAARFPSGARSTITITPKGRAYLASMKGSADVS